MESQRPDGLGRTSTRILLVSMFGLAALIDLRLLFGGVPFASAQTSAGSLVSETLLFFGLFALSLRYLEDKRNRIGVIVMLGALAVMFGLIAKTYLKLH